MLGISSIPLLSFSTANVSVTTFITMTKTNLTMRAKNTTLPTVPQVKLHHNATDDGRKDVLWCCVAALPMWICFFIWLFVTRYLRESTQQGERMGDEEAEILMDALPR